MKTITFKGVDVTYNVPDETKVENGKPITGCVTKVSDQQINVHKSEPVEKKKSVRETLFGSKNFTLTFCADDQNAKGTLTLRANEDWKAMRGRLVNEFNEAIDELIKRLH